MADIRLYREFFCFSYIGSKSTSQTLIDPYYISATTKLVSGSTIIEEPTPIQESSGIYYVNLNPILYTFSNIYELNWYVNYVDGTPQKTLPTRFKLNPLNIGSQIDIELLGNQIDIDLENQNIEIEIMY